MTRLHVPRHADLTRCSARIRFGVLLAVMVVGCSEISRDSVADDETILDLADGAVAPDASVPLGGETGDVDTTHDDGELEEGVPSAGVELEDEPLVFVRGARFSDIDGSFAQAMIRFLSGTGVVAGYSDGTYRPSRLLTRAELAALLAARFRAARRRARHARSATCHLIIGPTEQSTVCSDA